MKLTADCSKLRKAIQLAQVTLPEYSLDPCPCQVTDVRNAAIARSIASATLRTYPLGLAPVLAPVHSLQWSHLVDAIRLVTLTQVVSHPPIVCGMTTTDTKETVSANESDTVTITTVDESTTAITIATIVTMTVIITRETMTWTGTDIDTVTAPLDTRIMTEIEKVVAAAVIGAASVGATVRETDPGTVVAQVGGETKIDGEIETVNASDALLTKMNGIEIATASVVAVAAGNGLGRRRVKSGKARGTGRRSLPQKRSVPAPNKGL